MFKGSYLKFDLVDIENYIWYDKQIWIKDISNIEWLNMWFAYQILPYSV